MKVNTLAALGTALAIAALGLSACGSSSKSASKHTTGAVLPGSAMTTAAYSDLKQGGTLTQAVSQLPVNWVQLNAADNLGDTATIEGPITNQNGLTYNTKGQWQLNTDYIESAKLTSQSPQTIAVKLNPKGVWSDGKPITYADMVSMWKAFNGSNTKFQVGTTQGWQDIASITRGSDDYSYTIVYKKKNADWPNYMYPAYPQSVTSNPTVFNTKYESKPFPSNGPFVVSKIDSSGGVVTETPNPRWWGKKPKLDKVVFRVINQDSLGQAFANNELNVLDTQANPDVLAQAEKASGAAIQRAGGLEWTQVTFNGTRAPLNNVDVRHAVSMAIDREAMTKVIQSPLGVKPTVQDGYIYVPGQEGYVKTISTILPHSLSRSAAELKKAGYTKGADGYFAKDGKRLTVSFTVPSDTPTNLQRAQLIQGFLKKAGIACSIDTVPTAKYFPDYVLKLDYDLVTFTWQGTPFPVSTTESIFYPADAGQNFTGITDPALAGLWIAANGELTPSLQQKKVHTIDTTLANLSSVLPLSTTPTIWAVKKGIANIGATQWVAPWFDYSIVGFKK